MGRQPFLSRVVLKDYKSVGRCDVKLGQFSVLVGPNGSGKSNWLDSLRFVAESLRTSLEHALRERGGINEVRRRSTGHPRDFGIRLEMTLPNRHCASYAFQVGPTKGGGILVKREECHIETPDSPRGESHYTVEQGAIRSASPSVHAAIEQDRLLLGVVSGLPEFRPVFDGLTHMGFYNLAPSRIRELQSPDPSEILMRDGCNTASILRRMASVDQTAVVRIEEYLETIVPGVKGVGVRNLGPKETIEFRQEVPGAPNPWRFLASSMSDGTLRVLGVLVALFQGTIDVKKRVPLVGIEEPEVALHPAAAGALVNAIQEATEHVQVIVTSHSPDLLDSKEITSENILAVVADGGESRIGPIDDASREVLRSGLYTPGELLRLEQIQPSVDLFASDGQLLLFGGR